MTITSTVKQNISNYESFMQGTCFILRSKLERTSLLIKNYLRFNTGLSKLRGSMSH